MPTLLTVLLALVILVPPAAHALTLEITGGVAAGISVVSPCPEPGVGPVSGAGFTFSGSSQNTYCPGASNAVIRVVGTLTLDGVTYPSICDPSNPSCFTNSTFEFTYTFPDGAPMDFPHYHGPYTTAFTMTGHTELAGGVDFVGHGTLTQGYLSFPTDAHFYQRFDFTAPEPTAAALLALGLAAALLLPRVLRPTDG